MRDLEVRYRIRDLDALLRALRSKGIVLGEAVHADDQAYAPAAGSDDERGELPPVHLRTVGGTHLMLLERQEPDGPAWHEHVSAISDRTAMDRALHAMGYRPTTRVTSLRRTATLRNLTLHVAEVDGVGAFLGVQRRGPHAVPVDVVQAEIADFVASLGIEPGPVTRTLD